MLPNSPNVILAAERAAELSEKPARVVPTTAPQEGLAALLAFDPARRSRRQRRGRARGAADALRIGGVAPAARDDAQGRFTAGDAVGYAGGELVAWGDPAATLAATLDQIADGAELAHLHRGRAAAARPRRRRGARAGRASRSSTTRAASPPGGGSSARSDATRFASTEPLARRSAAADPLLSPPQPARPSRSTVPRRWRGSASRPGAT